MKLTVFLDYRCVEHSESFFQNVKLSISNTTIFGRYAAFEKEYSLKKKSDLWKENSWILHLDNEAFHKVIIIQEFLAKKKNSTNVIEQAPYSPQISSITVFSSNYHVEVTILTRRLRNPEYFLCQRRNFPKKRNFFDGNSNVFDVVTLTMNENSKCSKNLIPFHTKYATNSQVVAS